MSIKLFSNFSTNYSVVVCEMADPAERFAAEELSKFLNKISKAYFPIVYPETNLDMDYKIYIGMCDDVKEFGLKREDIASKEGYIIKTVGRHLCILGGSPVGTLYGVYTFLEDIMGIRWYTPTETHIPKLRNYTLKDPDISYSPILEYREPYYGNSYEGDWSARNKTNGHFDKLYQKHGGRMKYYKYFVHTFDHLIPVEKYFDTNPEYFSLVNGKRTNDHTQLCLTNPDVYEIVKYELISWIKDDPDARIFSISQNDWYNPCECEHCKKIDDQEESSAGSLIWFVNKLADDIKDDYPNIIIDTLAYQYTRKAPKNIKPAENVCVRLCSIECCFSHTLDKCEEIAPQFKDRVYDNSSFQKDLKDWAKVCDRVYIWDYVTNFTHYFMPFPNLRVLQGNIQFLIKNNVKGIFEQGTYAPGGGPDFNELRTWLLAKILWNPDSDVDALTKDFMNGYYKEAAEPLLTYINEFHDMIEKEGYHNFIFAKEIPPYFNDEFMERAEELFNIAKAKAVDCAETLWRVERAEMSIRFVRLANTVEVGTINKDEINRFTNDVYRYGLTRISEWRTLDVDKQNMLEGKLRLW